MEYLEIIIKGIITGVLCAFLILFGLRPAVAYPEFILELFENLWIFMILLIINYYVMVWDYTTGAILLLCILALIFDYVVFTNKGFKKQIKVDMQDNFAEMFTSIIEDSKPRFVPVDTTSNAASNDQSQFYNVLIKDIQALNFAYPGGAAPLK